MDKKIIKALLDLSPRSMSSVAEEAGVNQANLSAWFTQDRSISDDAIERVEKAIGIVNDDLATDRVFVWRTEFNFRTLQMLLDQFFEAPKLILIVKKRIRPYHLMEIYSQPLALVFDDVGHTAILIMKPTESHKMLIIGPNVPWFSPRFLKGTSWHAGGEGPDDIPQMAYVETPLYQHLKKGDVNKGDVSQIMDSLELTTWNDVIDKAKSKYLTPKAVMDLLDRPLKD